ncbi:MAG: hypothetical protein K0S76_2376 [Herbinix sp.]|jgi:tetratricopeptide (TPR) repeat protein|nr:hypothetical protein [Herbinix sp.]
MNIPSILIILIVALWLQYEIRKTKRLANKKTEDYWKRENQSNLTRRLDISNLDYISIPLDKLPMSDHTDATINSYRDIIHKLSDKKILNLTGITNTELKLKYGVSNLNSLSECDNNYTTLVSMLHKWGEALYHKNNIPEALAVLEYAVSCNSDVSKTYKLLAIIYKEHNTPEKIDTLIHILSYVKLLHTDTVIDELNRIKSV